ncbi:MAG: hypothetical protein HW394_1909 [Acidobacteria bacterium]|nr:hypothetical protein [Acidobacteriota bacterium]
MARRIHNGRMDQECVAAGIRVWLAVDPVARAMLERPACLVAEQTPCLRIILQGRSATIFNKSMLVMMPTGSFPCVTTNR